LSCEKICYFDLIKCAHDFPPSCCMGKYPIFILYNEECGVSIFDP
jgi:hypothetical protein